jgi:hypothetical protein
MSVYNLAATLPIAPVLLAGIGALVEIVGMREDFPRFLESDTAFWIRPEPCAFAFVKLKSHSE